MFSALRVGGMRMSRTLPSVPSRSFATEQQLKIRIKSVSNISKITKAMKMVAAAKLRGVQSALDAGKAYAAEVGTLQPAKDEEAGDVLSDNHMVLALTSDKGLCGAINGSISKNVKLFFEEYAVSNPSGAAKIFLLGDKGKAALERTLGSNFVNVVSEYQKNKVVSFRLASALAKEVLDVEFDSATIVHNQFKSVISYDTLRDPLASKEAFTTDQSLGETYEFEGEASETLDALYEFQMACRMYYYLLDSITAEQSARMTAMDNSSKNASEMLGDLQLIYNKNRQARITTELIEIISGSISLEEG